MRRFLSLSKALSDSSRVRVLLALRQGELCLCQLVELLGFAPSTVSRHLELLQRAGLVEQRKDGRWRYFRLAGPESPRVVREALRWVRDNLANDETIVADRKRLESIRGKTPEELSGFYQCHSSATAKGALAGRGFK